MTHAIHLGGGAPFKPGFGLSGFRGEAFQFGIVSEKACSQQVSLCGVETTVNHAYEKYSTPELVTMYEKAASEHGQANARRDFVAGNPAADTVAAIYSEIRSRGVEHQKMLLPLLLSSDIGVRSWAAAHALEFEARQGEAVLCDIAKADGIEAFNAKITLSEWRKGHLRFP